MNVPVISMEGIYEESKNKYRMFPGDILVCATTHSFVVELPIAGRMEDSRMMTWVVRPKTPSMKFPIKAATFKKIPLIEDIIGSNVEAMVLYKREVENIESGRIKIDAKEGSDMSGNVELMRLTSETNDNFEDIKGTCYNILSDEFLMEMVEGNVRIGSDHAAELASENVQLAAPESSTKLDPTRKTATTVHTAVQAGVSSKREVEASSVEKTSLEVMEPNKKDHKAEGGTFLQAAGIIGDEHNRELVDVAFCEAGLHTDIVAEYEHSEVPEDEAFPSMWLS